MNWKPLPALLLFACGLAAPACVRKSPLDTAACEASLPPTNSIDEAIARAESILVECPELDEQVFLYLLEVGKKNPGIGNRTEIVHLYDHLIESSLINAKRANRLLTQYLYVRFAAIDDINERFSSLSDRALDRLSRDIDRELALKKVGLQEVSGSRDQYDRAQDYAARMKDILESTKIQWNYLRANANR